MPANTAPIFGAVPNVNGVALTAVNVRADGVGTIGTDIFKAWTAGANGGWLSRIRVVNTATAASTVSTATTVRLFISSISTGSTTTANCFHVGEVAMPSVTVGQTNIAVQGQELPLNFAVPAGWTVLATMHLALAANTGLEVVTFGTDY